METKSKIFVEIGTCDFDTLLPLCENGWRGYFIEPINKYAEFIQEECTSKKYQSTISCCAISNYDGELEMWVSEGEDWVRGISHAVTQQGQKLLELEANLQFRKEKIKVPCFTLDTYIKLNMINHIDYMKVDVEGHEIEVFENYSWKIKPNFIKLEHSHIDTQKMQSILEKQGYVISVETYDMYAVN